MNRFPDEVRFQATWRPYQARVLGELEQHLDDERLHVIAAPGSGKTVLGLEVVHRLDAPALILAPTLAIRDQWVHRLIELFLPHGARTPDWISRDLDNPKFFNVATYQALHSVMSRSRDAELSEQEMEEEDIEEVEEGDVEEEEIGPEEAVQPQQNGHGPFSGAEGNWRQDHRIGRGPPLTVKLVEKSHETGRIFR